MGSVRYIWNNWKFDYGRFDNGKFNSTRINIAFLIIGDGYLKAFKRLKALTSINLR